MPQQSTFTSFKLVGRISIWFALVAFLGLAAVLVLSGVSHRDYLGHVESLAVTRERLPWVMLLGGLALTVGTGLTTWLLSLYSSFRVAGPLYRFARNLETGIRSGRVPSIRIRAGDRLQEECRLLQESLGTLYGHYQRIDVLAVAAREALERGDTIAAEKALDQLRQLRGRLRHDDPPYDFR